MPPRDQYGGCSVTGCSCYAKSKEDFRRKFTAIPAVTTRDGEPWYPEGWSLVEESSKFCRKHIDEFNTIWSEASTAPQLRSQGSAPNQRTSKTPVSSTGSEVGSSGSQKSSSKKSSSHSNVDASTGPALRTISDPTVGLVGTIAPNEGAGDCLFRAISCIVYGTEGLHWLVRDMICNWMDLNWHYYEDLFRDRAAFEVHVHEMRSLGVWGDGYEIFAAMHLYRRRVMIYSTGGAALSVPMRSLFESYELFAEAKQMNLVFTHCNYQHGHYEGVVNDADALLQLDQLSAGTVECECIVASMTDEVIEEQERAATARLLRDTADVGEQQAIIEAMSRENNAFIVTPEDDEDDGAMSDGAKATSTQKEAAQNREWNAPTAQQHLSFEDEHECDDESAGHREDDENLEGGIGDVVDDESAGHHEDDEDLEGDIDDVHDDDSTDIEGDIDKDESDGDASGDDTEDDELESEKVRSQKQPRIKPFELPKMRSEFSRSAEFREFMIEHNLWRPRGKQTLEEFLALDEEVAVRMYGLVQDLKKRNLELKDKLDYMAAAEAELKRTGRQNLLELLATAVLSPQAPPTDHCSWDELLSMLLNM
jgi:hypothetical protein